MRARKMSDSRPMVSPAAQAVMCRSIGASAWASLYGVASTGTEARALLILSCWEL
jgi:hypothetical protein